ncbi:hypothetical protein [Thalassotalea ganghwensis]
MNQPYRVRIKTKVKVRFGLFILAFGWALYFLLSIDFGLKQDEVKYGRTYLLEAIEKSSSGSYRGSTSSTNGKFKLPSGKIIHSKIYVISHNGLYCIAEVLINGKVSHYQTLKYDSCI